MLQKEDKDLVEFHYHEALDRCHMMSEIFDQQLLQHSVITSLSSEHLVKKTAEKISLLLGEMYRQLGQLELDSSEVA